MTFQYSTAVRNARLDGIQTTIGTSPVLKVFSGVEPANCAAGDPSGLLVTMNLPVSWMNPASAGVKAFAGTWSGVASNSGVAASWRIYDSGLVACHIQGDVSDLVFNNTNIAAGQTVTILGFTLTSGNA